MNIMSGQLAVELPLENGIRSISYTYHPFSRAKVKGFIILFVLLLFAYLAAGYMGNFLYGLIILSIGFLSLGSFYFPATYRLDENGVERVCLGMHTRKAWSEVRKLEFSSSKGVLNKNSFNGLRLSPFSKQSFLNSFRGLELPLCGDKSLIEAFIKRHIDKMQNNRAKFKTEK